MRKAPRSSRHNKGSLALYSAFSVLLASSLLLLSATYSAKIGLLTADGQEQFRASLLAGRLSNLIMTAEQQGILSETALPSRFLLYGTRPANYTIAAGNGTLLVRAGAAEARITTAGTAVVLDERGPQKTLRVSRE